MVINTKYNIGETVWYISQGAIQSNTIYHIKAEYVNVGNDVYDTIITYFVGSSEPRETSLYSTKEEAGIAWLKSQGLDCGVTYV